MTPIKIGELAGPEERFCPFSAVNKWPYRYLYGNESDYVTQEFFAAGKFRSRGWSIYYIRTLLHTSSKPLFLIPKSQVAKLFHEIFDKSGIYARFPDSSREPGFDIGFPGEGEHRPRYLGRFNNNCSLLDLEDMVPTQGSAREEHQDIDDRSFPAFRRKMEAAILAGMNKKKSAHDKRKRDRVYLKRGFCASLKRTQCYLGIRTRGTADIAEYKVNPYHTHEESIAAQTAYEIAAGLRLPPLMHSSPPPYPFDKSVVFISVDIESYERDHNKITEIGIATLDTEYLNGVPPGESGVDWMGMIRSRHFRIAEYAHLVNRDFVAGCPNKFENKFGAASEWISIKEAPQVIASCFRHPFSAHGQYTSYPADLGAVRKGGSGSQYLPPLNPTAPKRNIVLVGHEIRSDIDYFRTIGYDVTNTPNLLEAVDTINLFKAFKHGSDTPSLGTMLLELKLTGWNLHNAGNDAGYTLEALIGISLAALNATHKPTPSVERLDAAAAEVQARLIEDVEEWEIADEEGGDGGDAVKLRDADVMREERKFEARVRRAERAEERGFKSGSGRGGGCGGGGGAGRGRGRGGAHQPNITHHYPSPNRSGETKFHAANEKMMADLAAAQISPAGYGTGGGFAHENQAVKNRGWGGHGSGSKSAGGDGELDEKMKRRLKVVDADEDEYFSI